MSDSKHSKSKKDGTKDETKDEIKLLKNYLDLMAKENLVELELKDSSSYIKLKRHQPGEFIPAVPLVHPAIPRKEVKEEKSSFPAITSPLAGVFYRSASPQSEPFVKEGDSVSSGTILCIIEAMKVMNEIRAEKACTIKKILIENGKPVSAGQELFQVEY